MNLRWLFPPEDTEADLPTSDAAHANSRQPFEDPEPPPSVAPEEVYPSTRGSAICPPTSSGRGTLLWCQKHFNQILSPRSRGPIEGFPPALGVYSKNFDHQLHEACMSNDADLARKRLELGANPDQYSGPLRYHAIHYAAGYDAVDVIPVLIEFGCDVWVSSLWGEGLTCFVCAVMRGQIRTIRLLSNLVNDLRFVNNRIPIPWFFGFLGHQIQECTPLLVACGYAENVETVKALLECQADPHLTNKAGQTAFDMPGDSETGREIARILKLWKDKSDNEPNPNPNPPTDSEADPLCSAGNVPTSALEE